MASKIFLNQSFKNIYHLLVYEPIPICIGYRRRYGLFTDISVLPIRQLLIGIGYRYRPIWYLISVHNQIALLQSYDTNLTRKIWKNSSKWDFALLTEFVKKFLGTVFLSLHHDVQKKKKNYIKFLLVLIGIGYRYRPIRKNLYRYFIGIGR